jgi:hypothetical protein
MMANSDTIEVDPSADLSGLKTVFFDAGFIEENVSGLIKRCGTNRGVDMPSLLVLTEGPQRLNRLIRLFVLGESLPEGAAREALSPFPLERLISAGLIDVGRSGRVTSQACIMPYEDLLSVRDFGADWTGRPAGKDFVTGVSASSITLVLLTVRQQSEEALDSGTGGGIQAMLAAQHAHKVIGTDINPRALAFAKLAVRINGINNIELREGSLFDPMIGQRFDLIVSQPPFVISPDHIKTFRDSGLPGDTFCEEIIRKVPDYLQEGGWASIMFSWGHRNDSHWSDRPQTWVEGSGCDVWMIRARTDDVFSYAVQWVRGDGGERNKPSLNPLERWLAYYQKMGMETISTGVAVMRKRSGGKNWVRVDPFENMGSQGSCGRQIKRLFATETLLRSLPGPETLLDMRLLLTEEQEMRQTLNLASGAWQIKDTYLTQRQGFAFPFRIDRMSAELLSCCDGNKTLRSVIESLAKRFSLDFERLCGEVLPIVVRLMRSSYLSAV